MAKGPEAAYLGRCGRGNLDQALKVDRMTKETIRNGKEKDSYA
jgi:hypothetical protein